MKTIKKRPSPLFYSLRVIPIGVIVIVNMIGYIAIIYRDIDHYNYTYYIIRGICRYIYLKPNRGFYLVYRLGELLVEFLVLNEE